MKQNKAFKFRIYPTEEQKIIFSKTFGCASFIYNKMLSHKIDHYVNLVKVKQHRQIPKDYKIKSVTISQTPSEKYYASILFEYENQVQAVAVEPKTFLGLNFSMKELYVASDKTSAEYPRYFRKSQEKLSREQRELSKCVIGSQNRAKQRLKVARKDI